MWSLEFSADAERDFELIFDHLVKSYLEFSEDNDVAFERAIERIRGIRISANKLAYGSTHVGDSHCGPISDSMR